MLSAAHRLRKSEDFRRVVRGGSRGASHDVIAHVLSEAGAHSQVGLIVGRGVGGAVQRNLVKRRLRAIMAREVRCPGRETIVVRALPAAAGSDFGQLAASVRRALERARRAAQR